jgi:hypothetical protein
MMKRPKSPQETVDISRCTQIEGLPNYYANAERCEVANKFGYRIKVKVSGRKNGIKNYILYDNGKKCCISAARLMYAVQCGINPLKIPQSLVVIQNGDEGGYELRYKSDVAREGVNKRLRLWQKNIRSRINRKIQEGLMLSRYYDTGDTSEVIGYTIEQTNVLAEYIRWQFRWSTKHSMEVAMEAVEWFCQRIEKGDLSVTAITYSLHTKAYEIIKQRRCQRDIEWQRSLISNPKRSV